VVVRLYEAWGRRCEARLRTTLPASRAFLCDLLERERDEVPVKDGVIALELAPFKVVTLKLEP
jgi:alpha-mannosidase